jgi:putative transposase
MATNRIKRVGTYTQIYIQIVFSPKGRNILIPSKHMPELCRYIAGIIRNKGHKPIIINGMPDHIHIFVGLKPFMAISDLVRDVKNNSTNFINEQGWMNSKCLWQEGFGAFSYSQSQMQNVYNYILNQEEHHHRKSFKEEYIELLKEYQIPYKNEFLFVWHE